MNSTPVDRHNIYTGDTDMSLMLSKPSYNNALVLSLVVRLCDESSPAADAHLHTQPFS